MKIIQVLQQNPDGTQLAIINPTPVIDQPVFKTKYSCFGYWNKLQSDHLKAITISENVLIELLACDLDRHTGVSPFRVDQEGESLIVWISNKDVEYVSGNLGFDSK